jgi:peptidoglycan L-alanyl-D-glutamate endopeptidase CwlK
MPKFGRKSLDQLSSCHPDIQLIFSEVVKHFDCSIIEGHRSASRQNDHWQKGREFTGGDPKKRSSWKVVGETVTTKDGYEKKSRHQSFPSVAVDVVPYPTMWSDEVRMDKLAGVVEYVQDKLFEEGKIKNKLDWGYDLWKWDKPHFQLK